LYFKIFENKRIKTKDNKRIKTIGVFKENMFVNELIKKIIIIELITEIKVNLET